MMDCERAERILLEAQDGLTSAEDLAHAQQHCASCPTCARIEAGLDLLAAAQPPAAPGDLVDSVLAAVQQERARTAAQAAAHVPTPEAAGMPGRWRWMTWERRFAGLAAAAAIAVAGMIAIAVAIPGLMSATQRSQEATESAKRTFGAAQPGEAELSSSPEEPTQVFPDADRGTVAAAPPYIVLDGMVYRLVDERPRPADATTAGVVTSALDDPASEPTAMTAYARSVDIHAIWLGAPDGRTLAFELVTRTFAGDEYALESGSPVTRFGEWPTLPPRFAPPASAEGSPTFRFFGFDDRRVRIFVPAGAQPLDGFAVAPGTQPDDPAAGNPNWTWWSRID